MQYLSNSRRELFNSRNHKYMHGMVGMMLLGMAPDCIVQVVWLMALHCMSWFGIAWHGLDVLIIETHCC